MGLYSLFTQKGKLSWKLHWSLSLSSYCHPQSIIIPPWLQKNNQWWHFSTLYSLYFVTRVWHSWTPASSNSFSKNHFFQTAFSKKQVEWVTECNLNDGIRKKKNYFSFQCNRWNQAKDKHLDVKEIQLIQSLVFHWMRLIRLPGKKEKSQQHILVGIPSTLRHLPKFRIYLS